MSPGPSLWLEERVNVFALSVLHEAVRLFWVLCTAVGFVGVMGLIALVSEARFSDHRKAIVVWLKDSTRWYRRPRPLGHMPPGWRPRQTGHLKGAWRRT